MGELITLRNATLTRPGGDFTLRDLSWTVREGETWAITGPVGSGKTTLAELLLGRFRLDAGTIEWPFVERLRAAGRAVAWPAAVIEYVPFREESWLFSYARHYYQQRFNFIDPQDDLTLDQFLRAGGGADAESIRAAAAAVGVEHLRPLSLIKLSNGQTRRARIARALLSRPELLILDEPFMGLDAAGRSEVAELLGGLVRGGQRMVLIARPDLVPGWVTHVLEMGGAKPLPRPLPEAERGAQGPRRRNPLHSSNPSASPPRSGEGLNPHSDRAGTITLESDPLIELRHVVVAYGERRILDDVTWTVRAGERWAVLGPNGSGKSTLLSLLCGDHPQAYSNDVRLFGRRRGSGESIWDIKARVGLVSPELHLYFHEPLTAAQTAATGYFDVVALRPTTPEQDAHVGELFAHFGIADLADRPFARLSTGQQRLVLLLRALVKRPELLILDEPFQGFDLALAARLRDWLDAHLDPSQTLLFVTHHAEELPRTVTRRLILDAGRVVS